VCATSAPAAGANREPLTISGGAAHLIGMARIEGSSRPGLFGRWVYWVARRRFGRVPEPTRIMAHNRWAFAAMCMYEALLPKAHALGGRGKELASILAAMRVGCPF
jgi:hypothetical protein